jgi:hypothetical protein
MKRKKNAFSTLVLAFFCQSKLSFYILKIKKIKKSTPPTDYAHHKNDVFLYNYAIIPPIGKDFILYISGSDTSCWKGKKQAILHRLLILYDPAEYSF